jgi:3-oxoadipate enol-lactonase
MLQGVGVGARGWLPQIEALAARYTCVAFDNRGYGASLPQAEDLTVELMADDAIALMNAMGWTDAHLVGHSLGGLVALYVAKRAPERVRSLTLLCTFASGEVPTKLTPWMLAIGLRTRVGTRRMRRHAFLRLVAPHDALAGVDPDAMAAHLADLFGRDLADSPPVVMRQLHAMADADATPFLHGLAGIPTLVVSAAHDRIAPPHAGRALAAGIPGARYVELEDASHGVTIHQADRINALLLAHLDAASREPALAR